MVKINKLLKWKKKVKRVPPLKDSSNKCKASTKLEDRISITKKRYTKKLPKTQLKPNFKGNKNPKKKSQKTSLQEDILLREKSSTSLPSLGLLTKRSKKEGRESSRNLKSWIATPARMKKRFKNQLKIKTKEESKAQIVLSALSLCLSVKRMENCWPLQGSSYKIKIKVLASL